jgi:hypothetical protein
MAVVMMVLAVVIVLLVEEVTGVVVVVLMVAIYCGGDCVFCSGCDSGVDDDDDCGGLGSVGCESVVRGDSDDWCLIW